MSCGHHRKCGDCFGPGMVTTLEGKFKTLATAYVEATERNLATLEELAMLKSSSKSRVNRQRDICLKMLLTCVPLKDSVDWSQGMWDERLTKFSRTRNLLAAIDLKQGLDTFIKACQS